MERDSCIEKVTFHVTIHVDFCHHHLLYVHPDLFDQPHPTCSLREYGNEIATYNVGGVMV